MLTENQSSPWYRIQAAESGPAELMIFGDIGESWNAEESNTARSIANELKPLAGKALTVRINSYGGSCADGMAIYNALRRHAQAAPVTTTVEGVAMSSASIIAMAGDVREMAENALFMVHAPWSVTIGNSAEMRKAADVLDKYSEAMISAYSRSALTEDEIRSLLTDGEDHYYSAAEAEEAGFVTTIREDLPVAASYLKNRFTNRANAPIHQKESPMTAENPTGAEPVAVTEPVNEAPKPAEAAPVAAVAEPLDVNAAVQAALATERHRVKSIRTNGKKASLDDATIEALIDSGKPQHECELEILSMWSARVDATATGSGRQDAPIQSRVAELSRELLNQVSGAK